MTKTKQFMFLALFAFTGMVATPLAQLSASEGGSAIATVTTDTFGGGSNQFSIDFVTVGNPGNTNDTTGYGGVPYSYRIGKYTISQNQVNAALASGLQNVYSDTIHDAIRLVGTFEGPACSISWFDAAAFVNWLNTSSGYAPAYNLSFTNGSWSMALWPTNQAWTQGGANLFRNSKCHYFLPSDNEWYKAAYYDPNKSRGSGGYWLYTTGSDTPPDQVSNAQQGKGGAGWNNGGAGTNANTVIYGLSSWCAPADVTKCGGLSPYGTMGQGGNAAQWIETTTDKLNDDPNGARKAMGFCYVMVSTNSGWLPLSSSEDNGFSSLTPTSSFQGSVGFRVASIDSINTPIVPLDPNGDEDGDGLTNFQETIAGTNLYNKDSDGDGVSDYREIQDSTDPLNASSRNNLSKGLVAYYPLNGNAMDQSGNGKNGIINGEVGSTANQNGTLDSALSFAGNGYVSVTPTPVNITNDFTVAVWCYGNPISGNRVDNFISTGPDSSGGLNLRYCNFQSPAWQFEAGWQAGNPIFGVDQPSFESRWNQLLFVKKNETCSAYINGMLVGSFTPPSQLFDLGSMWIGRHNCTGYFLADYYLNGAVSDIRIYDRALTASEAGQLYHSESGNLDSDGDGLPDAYEQGQGRYEVISGNFTWDQAKADAESRTNAYGIKGHLVTITREKEWDIIKSNLESQFSKYERVWLGGSDAAQEGVWTWVTGEKFDYNRWQTGSWEWPDEPRDGTQANYLDWMESIKDYTWNDEGNSSVQYAYLLEYGYPSDPYKADTDGDGYNDLTEQIAGKDPNNIIAPSTRPNSFMIQSIQAGSTTDIDYILVRDLNSGAEVYRNDFTNASDNSNGITCYYWPQGGQGNSDYVINGAMTSVLDGKLRLECTGFNQNGWGGYESQAEVFYTNVLPRNFYVEVRAQRLQWPGHFHFHLYHEDPSDSKYGHVSGGSFSTNRNSGLTLEVARMAASGDSFQGYGIMQELLSGSWATQFPAPIGNLMDAHTLGMSLSNNVVSYYLDGVFLNSTTYEGWSRISSTNNSPIITLTGSNPLSTYKGSAFTDPGAAVVDGAMTNVITGEGIVDTTTLGSYTLTYGYTNAAGIAATPVNRTVNVILDPNGDEDGDGLTNFQETIAGTNLYNKDSDGDGVSDYREIQDSTDPLNASSRNYLSKGLVSYMPLNGTTLDLINPNNNGVIVGTVVATNNRFGNANGAYYFNQDRYLSQIAAANAAEFTRVSNSFTISFWFQPTGQENLDSEAYYGTSYGHNYAIFGVQGGDNSGISIGAGTNGISILEHGNGFLPVVLSYPVNLGTNWSHAVVTCDNNGAPILYVNGVNAKTGVSTGRTKITSLYGGDDYQGIGGGGYGNYKGSLSDIRIYDRALSATEVQNLFSEESGWKGTNVGVNDTTNGLVARYPLSGDASDRIGSSPGIASGVIWTNALDAAGHTASMVYFNGSSSVRVQQTPNLNISTSAITMSAWVNASSMDGISGNNYYNIIFGGGVVDQISTPYGISINQSGLAMTVAGSQEGEQFSAYFGNNANQFVANQWYYVTATYDGTNAFGYINGIQYTNTGLPPGNWGNNSKYSNLIPASLTAPLIIGARDVNWPGFDHWFQGLMYDVRIYNRALSSNEVSQLYALGSVSASISGSGYALTNFTGTLIGDVTLPTQLYGSTVTAIGDGALAGQSSMTSLTIPTNITTIGSEAFANCSSLGSITIPDSVVEFGTNIFAGCTVLTNIVASPSMLEYLASNRAVLGLSPKPTPTPTPTPSSGGGLSSTTAPSGKLYTDISAEFPELARSGLLAQFDYDQDGKLDLLVWRDDSLHLLRKLDERGYAYEDKTQQSGLTGLQFVNCGDIDNDGWPDLICQNSEGSQIFLMKNQHDGNFQKTEITASLSGDLQNRRTSIMLADIDGDGKLDLVFGINPSWGGGAVVMVRNHSGESGAPSTIFTDKSYLAIVSWNYPKLDLTDANNDGKMDLLVMETNGNWPNDTHPEHPVHLYLNTGKTPSDYFNPDNGKSLAGFTEKQNCGLNNANEMSPMASFDIDGTGNMSLINGSSDWRWVSNPHIYVNDGQGKYTQMASPIVAGSYYHHGIALFDADLDNRTDGVWTGLHNFSNLYPRMWRNDGNLQFSDVTSEWGITCGIFGSGNLGMGGWYCDIDGDGAPEFQSTGNNGWGGGAYNALFRNDATQQGKHWLKVKLVGGRNSPRDGHGARVVVKANGRDCAQFIANDVGSLFSTTLSFGLGNQTSAESIKVYWPSGNVTTLGSVDGDQTVTIQEQVPSTNPVVTSLHVKALIDGPSQLIISSQGIQWYHWDWTAVPGRHNGANQPTILNGVSWYPVWPEAGENRSINAYSSFYTGFDVTPFLSGNPVQVTINNARDNVWVTQEASSGATVITIMHYNDLAWGGSDNYDVTISTTASSNGPIVSADNDLYVGSNTPNNSLVLGSGTSTYRNTYVGFARGSSNNQLLVSGAASLINTNNTYVGYDGSGNSLVVTNGALLVNIDGIIGASTTSSNNSVLVTGAGSSWTNSGRINVGDGGSGNMLIASNGGVISTSWMDIGHQVGSSNNSLYLTGVGSHMANSGNLAVGAQGGANTMVLSNGAKLQVDGITYLGYASTSASNQVIVTGAGTLWTNSYDIDIGTDGSYNSLLVSDGATIIGANKGSVILGLNPAREGLPGSSNNTLILTGSNSTITGFGLGIGLGEGNNVAVINQGATMNANGVTIGVGTGGNNSLTVSDEGTTLNTTESIVLGWWGGAPNNSMLITNGAKVISQYSPGFYNSSIGSNTNSYGNNVSIAGSGSLWSNASHLFVGDGGYSNTLAVTDGGSLISSGASIGRIGNSNQAVVTGTHSSWSAQGDVTVGDAGYSNELLINNGGRVINSNGVIGREATASNNLVSVSGAGSAWSNSQTIVVGVLGSSNSLVISNGGTAFAGGRLIISGSSGSNNSITVSGTNSSLTSMGDSFVGSRGSGSSLMISNGASVISGASGYGTIIGAINSSQNSVMVTGNGSYWTNSQLYIGGYSGSDSNNVLVSSGGRVESTYTVIGTGAASYNSLTIANEGTMSTPYIIIGDQIYSSSNSLHLTDAGSRLHGVQNLNVGNEGWGNSMTISNGALVESSNGVIGNQVSSSQNSVLVAGFNSLWSNSAGLTIGNYGSGTLTVANGGNVYTTDLTIAAQSGSSATINYGRLGQNDMAGAIQSSNTTFGAGSWTANFNQTDLAKSTVNFAGNGVVNQLGSGSTVLTGSNAAFAGPVNIVNGTLAIGDGITTGGSAVTGNILNNSTLVINPGSGDTYSLPGVISGSGTVVITGSGMPYNLGYTALSGSNSYTGGTMLQGAHVIVANDSAFGTGMITHVTDSGLDAGINNLTTTNAISVPIGTVLALNNGSNNWTISSPISGQGSVGFCGTGTTTLTSSNSLTGPVAVTGGLLNLTGSLPTNGSVSLSAWSQLSVTGSAGNVEALWKSTLSGTGSVGNVTVSTGATITPGVDKLPGTLSLQSALWAPGGNYNWVLNDASGVAGSGFSSLNIASALDLSQLSATNRFNINVSAGTNGLPLNFNGLVSTNWTIASFGSITNFSASNFAINTVATNGALGWSGLTNGTLGISTNGNNLELTYTAKNSAPDWQTPSGKRYSAVIYAKVLDENGNPITAYGSRLAVFNGNSVAGVASPFSGPGGSTLFTLTVYADQSPVNGMTYKVYDAATGNISILDETYDFTSGVNTGTIANPIVLHIVQRQSIDLYEGWSWVCFGVVPSDGSVATLMKNHAASNDDVIIGTKGSATYYEGVWYPSSEDFSIEAGRMYLISSSRAATLTVTGQSAKRPMTMNLVHGWNWIGNPTLTDSAMDTLYGGIQPSDDDCILDQDGNLSTFYQGVWYANTTDGKFPMKPGKGYLLYKAIPQSIQIK